MKAIYNPTIRTLLDLRGSYHLIEEALGVADAARAATDAQYWELVEGGVVDIRDDAACQAAANALAAAGCVALDCVAAGAGHALGMWRWYGLKLKEAKGDDPLQP